MLRPKRVKNGTTGAGRISSVVVVAWLFFSWSRPALPDEQPHLRLAPISVASSVSGNIGYEYQSSSLDTYKSTAQTLDVNAIYGVRARSFFWQPWLAQVSAALGFGAGVSTSSYSGASTAKSGKKLITGDAALDIVKNSRFPFQARVFRSDDQTSGFLSGVNSDYINRGYSLTQNYRSRDNRLDSMASYTHSTGGRASFGTENAVNQLNFTVTEQPLHSLQSFRIVGAMTDSAYPLQGTKLLVDTLVTNHLYQPNSAFSVGSLVNLIKTNYTATPTSGIGAQQQNDFNSQQLSSFASWRPEGSPMTMTGSARLLRTESSSNGVTAAQYNDTNLNLGANYAWSKLLRMYGSVNVNDNSGIQTISTNAALAAQKGIGERDMMLLGGFRYTQSVGASLSNQTVTTNGPNQTTTTSIQQLGGNIGHDLNKISQLGGGSLTTDLNQGLSTILSTRGSPFTHLQTGGSLSWNRSEGRGNTRVRLNAADSRDLSGTQKFFQLINLQASRIENLAHHQSLIGNLTLQASRSGAKGIQTTPFVASPSADLTYQNQRVFNVRNLTFESILRVVGADIILSSQNLPSQTQNQASVSWDNNMDYFIGRVKLRLLTRLAEVNNSRQSSLYFTMNRAF
jgi:hypothetical protein